MMTAIDIGARYEYGDLLKRTWVVTDLVTPPTDTIPHARMMAEADASALKMVSVVALRDPRLFRRLS